MANDDRCLNCGNSRGEHYDVDKCPDPDNRGKVFKMAEPKYNKLIAQLPSGREFMDFHRSESLEAIIQTDWFKKRSMGKSPIGEPYKIEWPYMRVRLG